MTYDVRIVSIEEGYAVWCPELPGCWSQGVTEPDALENIRVAISEYLADETGESPLVRAETRTVEVG